jgi:hypothetical protein
MEAGTHATPGWRTVKPDMQPAAGMRLYYLDDAGVLFSEAGQELHLLNPTAAVIWSLLEEGCDEPAIITALQETHGLDVARAREYVSMALADWREKGFLGDAVTPSGSGSTRDAALPVKGPPWTGEATHHERHYRLLSSHIAIRFSSDAQVRVVHPVLEHLEAGGNRVAPTPTRIDIIESGDRLLVYRDQEFFAESRGIDALAPVVKSLVWVTVLRDHAYFLDIHAGVVSDGTQCVVLPAPPGSGKSTLTASLVHAGFEFFSDEIALLQDATLHVFPVPLAICIKDAGIDALADRFPQVRTLPLHRRGDGKRVAYLSPPAQRRPSTEHPRPVRALVFPHFARGASTSLEPLPRAQALQRLMSQCMVVAEPLTVDRVETLVRWVAGVPCYALEYGSTDGAIDAMTSVFPAPAGSTQGK